MALSVIILDDDAIQVNMFSNVLRHHYAACELELSFIADGDEVFDMIGKKPDHLHLLVTDIKHPGADGLELARVCKQEFENVTVVIQTAFAGDEHLEEAAKYADHVLQKPYKMQDLIGIIDDLLKRKDNVTE